MKLRQVPQYVIFIRHFMANHGHVTGQSANYVCPRIRPKISVWWIRKTNHFVSIRFLPSQAYSYLSLRFKSANSVQCTLLSSRYSPPPSFQPSNRLAPLSMLVVKPSVPPTRLHSRCGYFMNENLFPLLQPVSTCVLSLPAQQPIFLAISMSDHLPNPSPFPVVNLSQPK